MTRSNRSRAFTIIELLVVVSIIALLIGILLPAIGKARDQAKLTMSQANLRNLGTAHESYSAEWNDRQVTWAVDTISAYGGSRGEAFPAYHAAHGGCSEANDPGCHPGMALGWGQTPDGYISQDGYVGYWCVHAGNTGMVLPMGFADGFYTGFGSFRVPNGKMFSQYVSGRFYDPVFYAPKDTMVYQIVDGCFRDPYEFASACQGYVPTTLPYWSSYCLSPAAMFSPDVMRGVNNGGWQSPWELPAGYRSPSVAQALYPDLKSRMLEHHWLQQRRSECNPAFTGGVYDNCEPYYFNHGWESVPVTLFYDGHVEGLGVREAEKADSRVMAQTDQGLWSRDTDMGSDGYFINYGYDFAETSFHILTTDGIRGRDKVGDG